MRTVYVNSDRGLWSATRPDDWSDPDEVSEDEFVRLNADAAERIAVSDAEAAAAAVIEQQGRFDKIAEKFDEETAELLVGPRPKREDPKGNNGKGRDSDDA